MIREAALGVLCTALLMALVRRPWGRRHIESWPTIAQTWHCDHADGPIRRHRVLVTVELWQKVPGWVLVERYGPATRRRWLWGRQRAEARFELATLWAELFVEDLAGDSVERRQRLRG